MKCDNCQHCESMALVCNKQCERCEWRHMARSVSKQQDAWWLMQKVQGKNMAEIEAYWQEVWAHDDLKQAASG